MNPGVFKQEGLKHLDRVVALCAKYEIYTVIDLHAAPGGQNIDWHSDSGINKAMCESSGAGRGGRNADGSLGAQGLPKPHGQDLGEACGGACTGEGSAFSERWYPRPRALTLSTTRTTPGWRGTTR